MKKSIENLKTEKIENLKVITGGRAQEDDDTGGNGPRRPKGGSASGGSH